MLDFLIFLSPNWLFVLLSLAFILLFLVVVGLFYRPSTKSADPTLTPGPTIKLSVVSFLIVMIVGVIMSVLAAFLTKFSSVNFSDDIAHWGQAGDFFGGMLNPILAFASCLALLYTIRLQSKQLEYSKKELAESKIELIETRLAQQEASAALSGQLEILTVQKFETSFFVLLEFLGRQVEQFRGKGDFESKVNKVLNPLGNAISFMRPSRQSSRSEPEDKKINNRWTDAFNELKTNLPDIARVVAACQSILSLIQHQQHFNDNVKRVMKTKAGKMPDLTPEHFVALVRASFDNEIKHLLIVWCHGEDPSHLKMLAEEFHLFSNFLFGISNNETQAQELAYSEIGEGLTLNNCNLMPCAFGIGEWPNSWSDVDKN